MQKWPCVTLVAKKTTYKLCKKINKNANTFTHKKKKPNHVAGMQSAIPIKIKASIKPSCVETIAVSCIKTKKQKKKQKHWLM